MKIGILALQGAFKEHKEILDSLNVENSYVKAVEDLEGIDGIILPGGESTTMGKLLRDFGMLEILRNKIVDGLPVLGTCAGMILLAKKLYQDDTKHLDVMDIEVRRNAYGRQLGSFKTTASFKGIESPVEMVFIRAPYATKVGENVDILSIVDGNIVATREKNMLAISFHPELNGEKSVHKYFIEMIEGKR